jgi:Type I restriction modification DNA specificity domain
MSEPHRRIGALPKHWKVGRFGDVLEGSRSAVHVNKSQRYREIGIRSHGKGVFHKEPVSGTELGDKRVFWVEADRLVFNIIFAWERAVAVTSTAEQGMVASHRFPMYRPSHPGSVDVDFLRRFFLTDRGARLLAEASPGGAGRNRTLNQKFLADTPVPLPPLSEQRKIAAILSAVDQVLEKTEAAIESLQMLKKAMMQELLTRGLPDRHVHFRQTEIGEIPAEWDLFRLAEIARVQTGVAKGKVTTGNAIPVPYLRVANVQDGYLDLDELKTIEVEANQVDRYRLCVGDVLFTEGGDADKVGRGFVWSGEIDLCLHQNHVFAVRVNSNRILPQFLSVFRASRAGKAYFMEAAKQTTNLASINSTQLKQLPVPAPSIEEQREIVRALGTFSDWIDCERRCADAVRAMKAALMSGLLTGELRVSPNEDVA